MILTCKTTAQSKNRYETINMFMRKTHKITWFQDIWQLSLWIWCVFSVKNTNKPKQHRHAPNNDVSCAEPRGLKRPSVWVSRDRWEELRNGGQIITHVCMCCNHHTTTLLHLFPWQSCLTSPNSLPLLHRWCLQSVFALHNRSSWSFLLLSSVVLLYSPTDWFVLVPRFWAHTATFGPQLVGGEDSQSFSV